MICGSHYIERVLTERRESTYGSDRLKPFSFSSLWYMLCVYVRMYVCSGDEYFSFLLVVSFIMLIAVVVVVACSCSGSVQRRSIIGTTNPNNNNITSNGNGSHHRVEYRLCKCINRTTTLSLFFYADLVSFELFACWCFGIHLHVIHTPFHRYPITWQHLKNLFHFDSDFDIDSVVDIVGLLSLLCHRHHHHSS